MIKKRSHCEKHRLIQEALERNRRFDYDYIPIGTRWTEPDGKYNFRGSIGRRFSTFFMRLLTATLGALALKIVYGARVTGKRNLRAIGKQGAICVSNHFSFLDTLFVRHAVGYFRSYHTMAPYNNKKGLGGWVIRRGGMLPFSSNYRAECNLRAEITRLLRKGKIINFYSEQAMWLNYSKPRPMKDGAFYYAYKNDVPVLPVFSTFRKTRRGHIKRLRIHILPPVYADPSLPRKESVAAMKESAEREWRECYERAYAKPLEYLPAIRNKC